MSKLCSDNLNCLELQLLLKKKKHCLGVWLYEIPDFWGLRVQKQAAYQFFFVSVAVFFCVHLCRVVLYRQELEPCPTPVCFTCISMKPEVIYPSAGVSLSLNHSNRHWSLSLARWPTALLGCCSLASLSFVPGKGLDPTHCCGPLHMDLTTFSDVCLFWLTRVCNLSVSMFPSTSEKVQM